LLVIVAALALNAASVSLNFVTKTNLTNADVDFPHRDYSTSIQVTGGMAFRVHMSRSVAVDKSDVMFGIGSFPSDFNVPSILFAQGYGENALKASFGDFKDGLYTFLNPKLKDPFKGNVVVMVAAGIQEISSDGTTVGDFFNFKETINLGDDDQLTGDGGNLDGVSFVVCKPSGDSEVRITFVASNKAGVLSYGYTPVSARSYEMIIEVTNFPLHDPSNHIRLIMDVATSGDDQIEGNTLVLHREGKENLYAALSNYTVVYGYPLEAKVTFSSGGYEIGDTYFRNVMKAAIGHDFLSKSYTAYVDFPEGANYLIYDPAVGAGRTVYDAVDLFNAHFLHGESFSFMPNLNLTNAEKDFSYRKSSRTTQVSLVATMLHLSKSIALDESDTLVGIGSHPSAFNVPFALLAQGYGSDAAKVKFSSFADGLYIGLGPSLPSAFKGNVVGMVALGIQEYDSDGNAVGGFFDFKRTAFKDDLTSDGGNLNGISFITCEPSDDSQVTITYAASNKAGVVEYGYTPVSPRSYEMIVEITNFPLHDPSNHIRLSMGLVTSGDDEIRGNALVLHREGQEDLYAALSNYSIINGNIHEVLVSIDSEGTEVGDFAFKGIMKAAIGSEFKDKSKTAYIDFPAGATDVIYDPALGAGRIIYDAAFVIPESTSDESSDFDSSIDDSSEPFLYGDRFGYLHDVNLTNAEKYFSYRYCSSDSKLSSVATVLFRWRSVSIDESVADDSAKESADVIMAAGSLPNGVNPPFAVLAQGFGVDALKVKASDFVSKLFIAGSSKLNSNFAGNAVAMAAIGLQEYDKENNKVGKFINFQATCSGKSKLKGDEDNLGGSSCTITQSSVKITISYLSSKKAGVVEYGNTPVSPRSYDMMIKIEDFPLSDPENHVAMTVNLFTSSGAAVKVGKAAVFHREGQEDLYAAVSRHAIIRGERVKVYVAMESDGEADLTTVSKEIVKATVGSDFETTVATVHFPAGAGSFIYDPALGVGSNVYDAGNDCDDRTESDDAEPTFTEKIAYIEGANLTNAENDFSYRYCSSSYIDPGFIATMIHRWRSVSIDESTADDSEKESANVLLGIGSLPSAPNVPYAVLAYGTGSEALKVKTSSFARNLVSVIPKLYSPFDGNVVAMVALGMQEYDSEGNSVGKFISFKSVAFKNDLSADYGNLNGMSFTYSPSGTSAKVTITYAASNKAGVVEYGFTPVSPRSYEMIVEVKGFPLKDESHHIRLSMGLVTSGDDEIRGNALVLHREGQEDLYAALSNYSIINGNIHEVLVSIDSEGTEVGDFAFKGIMKAAIGSEFKDKSKTAYIDFPAGATDVIYDPALGAGPVIYDATIETRESGTFDTTFTFQRGVNLTDAENDFSYRYCSDSYDKSSPIATMLHRWRSVSIDESTADDLDKEAADVMLSVGSLPNGVNAPFAVFAHGHGSKALKVKISDFARNLFIALFPKLDENFEGNVVAMAALGLQEYTPDGEKVGKFVSFKYPCSSKELERDDDNLSGSYCTFTQNSVKITITYLASKKAGVVEYGNTPVSPRSYDMLIEVRDFPLSDPKNHIGLTINLFSSYGAGDLEGVGTVVHREGKDDLYAAVSRHAVIEGVRTKVNVDMDYGEKADVSSVTSTVLKEALGSEFDTVVARVDFPAGVSNFIYDPVLGAGSNVYNAADDDDDASDGSGVTYGKRIRYVDGMNLTNAEKDFSFRYTSSSFKLSAVATKLLLWRSVSVDESIDDDSFKTSADVMLGVGSLPSNANVPFSVFAYGSGSAALKVKISKFTSSLFALTPRLDGTFEGGVVALAALGMQEYDRNGEPVGKFISFKHVSLYKKIRADRGNLNGLSFTYTPSGTSAELKITYITSMKAGIIEYGFTPVSPRSFEMIIEVSGFPLKDESNHVRMDIGVLTASGAGALEANSVVLRRKGQEDMYVAVSNYSIVDGNRVKVHVDIESGEPDTGSISGKIMKTALGGQFDAHIAHVDFPAGARDFIYDPALGSGANIYAAAEFLNGEGSGHGSGGSIHGASTHNDNDESSNQNSNDFRASEENAGEGLGIVSVSLIVLGAAVIGSAVAILAVCLVKSKDSKKDEKESGKEKSGDDADISKTYLDDDVELDSPVSAYSENTV